MTIVLLSFWHAGKFCMHCNTTQQAAVAGEATYDLYRKQRRQNKEYPKKMPYYDKAHNLPLALPNQNKKLIKQY